MHFTAPHCLSILDKHEKSYQDIFFYFYIYFYRLVTILGRPILKKEEVSNQVVPCLVSLNNSSLIELLQCFTTFLFFLPPTVDAQLDDVGLSFVKNSISAIEKRGDLHMC